MLIQKLVLGQLPRDILSTLPIRSQIQRNIGMSLRRSARNAKPTSTEAPQALYQKTDVNGTSKQPSSPPRRGVDHPAPFPDLNKKPNARTKAMATSEGDLTGKFETSKATSAPEKPAIPRKRKASGLGPDLPVDIVTQVIRSPEIIASSNAPPEFNGVGSVPMTPVSKQRQRRKKADTASPAKPVPFTPTPSGVGLIAGSENVLKTNGKVNEDHMFDSLAALNRNRPAAPDVTNAPVLTPGSSQVVVNDSPSKKRKANDLPPDVGSPMKSTSTIDTLLEDAEAYLIKVDKEWTGNGRLERLIAGHKCKMFNPEGLREVVDPFTALASGIIGQQVSGAAAASIRKKFTALFEDTHPAFPSPAHVLNKDMSTLRSAGLSQRKAEYITGLAEKFASGEFTAEGLVSASDEELIEKLVAVRGLGRWSVEMFACFGLKRMDVFSTGDLGVQRGMAAYMGRDVSRLKNKGGKWKYMTEQEMLSIASKFSPYRSLFMWYMWRIADVDTEVLE
ncbi:3-methyladenine DNA glycosylase [Didymella heteroderae]|uniref:3-methyladenine DNA glycosylase n=1 Tax=Didymella heteroderae TaxID=1769908 RepID=A0A9P4WH83_9PLEO|nr:3-methyladenine DNA glycosylase [Didymella heteroderae]